MKLKHSELLIPDESPFANCKLGRKQYADVLTKIVGNYADGFVLAINNEWGTGKTTFVRMWSKQLMLEGYTTLFFNAWENDFEVNPLTAILAELKKVIPKGKNAGFDKVLQKGAVIAKSALPAIIKGAAKRYIDLEQIADEIEASSKGVVEVLKDEIDAYSKKQKGIHDFRKELEKYISEGENSKPLIFIIDELDRCRPDYAVAVLEQMKHIFNVPGIVFVLSIDKVQLGNAVKGVYGSESLNATEYLRRFIDVEFSIPEPSIKEYCQYLFDYFNFSDFFLNNERLQYGEFKTEEKYFLQFSLMLFQDKNMTLRQIEKVYSHARLALSSFGYDNYLFPAVYFFLIFSYSYEADFFKKLFSRKYTLEQLFQELRSKFPIAYENGENKFVDVDSNRFILNTQVLVLFFYYIYCREGMNIKLFERSEEQDKVNLLINLPTVNKEERTYIEQRIYFFNNQSYSDFSLKILLDRVALLKDISR